MGVVQQIVQLTLCVWTGILLNTNFCIMVVHTPGKRLCGSGNTTCQNSPACRHGKTLMKWQWK